MYARESLEFQLRTFCKMNPEEYEVKTVIVLDAVAKQELGDEDNPTFIDSLILLLQDVETKTIFQSMLSEPDVRMIIGVKDMLTSKNMIDLAINLRQREAPLRLMVPKASGDISASDILMSKNLDRPKKNRNRRRRRNKRPQNAVK